MYVHTYTHNMYPGCIYIYIYIHVYVYIHAHACWSAYILYMYIVYVYTYIYIHMFAIYIYIYIHVSMHACYMLALVYLDSPLVDCIHSMIHIVASMTFEKQLTMQYSMFLLCLRI